MQPCDECQKIIQPCDDCRKITEPAGGADGHDALKALGNPSLVDAGGYYTQRFECQRCHAPLERREEAEPSRKVTWYVCPLLVGHEASAQAGEVGCATQERRGQTEYRTYRSAAGAQSESERDSDRVRMKLLNTGDIGQRSERNVVNIIVGALRSTGHVAFEPDKEPVLHQQKKRSDSGSDGVISVDGRKFVVQVVTVGPLEAFALARSGTYDTNVTHEEAAAWIEAAIDSKIAKDYDSGLRSKMVLALDARHVGVLCDEQFVERLRPMVETKAAHFGAAWLIGSFESDCRILWNRLW